MELMKPTGNWAVPKATQNAASQASDRAALQKEYDALVEKIRKVGRANMTTAELKRVDELKAQLGQPQSWADPNGDGTTDQMKAMMADKNAQAIKAADRGMMGTGVGEGAGVLAREAGITNDPDEPIPEVPKASDVAAGKAGTTAYKTEGEGKGEEEGNGKSYADTATLNVGKQRDPDRDYLVADAIATFLRNTGRDFGNVAAAYTGGSYNNERDESLLSQRAKQRAQAETDEQILADFPNSEKAAELKGAQLANANKATQRQYALMIMNRFYDKNGKFIGDVNSADFKNTVTLCNQLMNGGGAKDSLLSQLVSRFAEFTGF